MRGKPSKGSVTEECLSDRSNFNYESLFVRLTHLRYMTALTRLIFGTSVYHDKKFMSSKFQLPCSLTKLQHPKKCFNFRPNCGFYDLRTFK